VDEIRLWVMPVVVGAGQRLFEDIDPSSLKLALADVRKLAGGSVILTYVPSQPHEAGAPTSSQEQK
jgi:dihydrofolate reductase